MMGQKDVVEALKAEGIRENVRVMVGGAVLTASYAEKIGADFYAKDAIDAVKKVNLLT
jgi:dimethylamine corrinoid protein